MFGKRDYIFSKDFRLIIVKIIGGLTSQMHKYSIGRALSIKHNVPLKLDLSWFDNDKKSDTSWSYQLDFYTHLF